MIVGGGTVAGVGFTVSLLISSLAFHGRQLAEAKLGVLAAAVVASLLAWGVFRVIGRLPVEVRARQIAGTADELLDLSDEVDPERDHVRGSEEAVTLVEYGDYECPYCGRAEVVIRELLDSFGDDLRYVWRHLPLNDVHPNAQMAAEAAEAAAAQGAFWEMNDALLAHQGELAPADLKHHARGSGPRRRALLGRAQGPRPSAPGWRRMSPPPTPAGSPARRASSSTAGATATPTTQ